MSKEVFEIAKHYVSEIEEAWENEELMDYIDDHELDVEYTISRNFDYIGVEIAIALGGPSVYINTRNKRVEAYWGGEQGSYPLDSDLCSELDFLYEEIYESNL